MMLSSPFTPQFFYTLARIDQRTVQVKKYSFAYYMRHNTSEIKVNAVEKGFKGMTCYFEHSKIGVLHTMTEILSMDAFRLTYYLNLR